MKHVFGIISQALDMCVTYVTILLSLVFDAIVFALPILLIYNFTLISKFSVPELNYLDIVGLVFLIKLMAVLWKSVNVNVPQNNIDYLTEEEQND